MQWKGFGWLQNAVRPQSSSKNLEVRRWPGRYFPISSSILEEGCKIAYLSSNLEVSEKMASSRRNLPSEILEYLGQQLAAGQGERSPEAITTALDAPRSTVNYHLARMVAVGSIQKRYGGPATRYGLPAQAAAAVPAPQPGKAFQFSAGLQPLIEKLTAPIGTRKPVAYQRSFVEDYVPRSIGAHPAGEGAGAFREGAYARTAARRHLCPKGTRTAPD